MTSLYIENYEIEDKFLGLEVLLSTHSLLYCGKHVKLRRGACCNCLGVLVCIIVRDLLLCQFSLSARRITVSLVFPLR